MLLTFHFQNSTQHTSKLYNTHVILDDTGKIQGTYCKTHMFDLDIPGKIRLCESDYTIPGNCISTPVETPVGNVGMGIVSYEDLLCFVHKLNA